MPFGRIFAAVFFGVICGGFGLRKLFEAGAGDRWFGGLAALAGISLAVALLTRRGWARWAGIVAAALISWFGVSRLPAAMTPGLLLAILGSVASMVLLMLPATGRVRDATGGPIRRGLDPAALAAAIALAGMAFLYVQGMAPAVATAAAAPAAAPIGAESPTENLYLPVNDVASAKPAPSRVVWTDFGSGIQQAKERDVPMLVHFYASWCGYCKKMDRETWADPEVVARTAGMINVRVDVDQTEVVRGYSGERVAGRYGIRGTPSQMIVDGDGELLARAGGFQRPGQLLGWLEDSMP